VAAQHEPLGESEESAAQQSDGSKAGGSRGDAEHPKIDRASQDGAAHLLNQDHPDGETDRHAQGAGDDPPTGRRQVPPDNWPLGGSEARAYDAEHHGRTRHRAEDSKDRHTEGESKGQARYYA
jgi:hypothetical protein